MANKKGKLYFDGVKEDVLFVETTNADGVKEITAHTKDRRFVKFPTEFPKGGRVHSLEDAIAAHNEANKVKPEPGDPQEAENLAELEAWFEDEKPE